MRLPAEPGTYALVLASAAEREIEVGRIGRLQVVPGYYVYVGSALGPGGLAARVARHQAAEKTARWHIDYLRAAAELAAVWYTRDEYRQECRWAEVLSGLRDAAVPMRGFGASDCGCCSHLFFFEDWPAPAAFRQRLRKAVADHALRCVTGRWLGPDQAHCRVPCSTR
jgi:Uri superfamily endonuclease